MYYIINLTFYHFVLYHTMSYHYHTILYYIILHYYIISYYVILSHIIIIPSPMKALLMQNERMEALQDDSLIAMQEPANIENMLKRRMVDKDTGAGVFGALNHITLDGKKKLKAENIFSDPDWTQDDTDSPPDWIVNRRMLDAELEEEFKTTPFETYALTRGQINGMMGSTLKIVGRFKGLIRVVQDKDEPSLFDKELLDSLFKPSG